MTDGQLVLMIVQKLNCTPLEAKRELRENHDIFELLELVSFEEAHEASERWKDMDSSQRKGLTEPKGTLVSKARKFKKEILTEQFEEQADQLKAEGRA